ncbi:glucan endo-1,3-beta-glucosidase 2 isoform X1 [Gossypium hirsutum]|uniref:Glucan endo-1,3-beta-glucosidase 2 isoform X1 n=1 Tax=Gossypium hirsutum TaxID=3635 RepID=A0ABM3ABI2_GOSHI|nr:glucan endo-1,3-beta-glucosidase 2-like isoform X1 [Gossypium hirsutum]
MPITRNQCNGGVTDSAGNGKTANQTTVSWWACCIGGEYACRGGKTANQTRCKGPCFEPNSRMHHASFAMNLYYQANDRHLADCNFINSGLVSLIDPSYGNCSFHSGGGLADEEPSETWCVAKPGTSDELLQLNINFACNLVDCNATHSGGVCYYPATLINHASYAMNLYYQITGRKKSNCNFRETSLIVSSDPSYGNCSYPCFTVQ